MRKFAADPSQSAVRQFGIPVTSRVASRTYSVSDLCRTAASSRLPTIRTRSLGDDPERAFHSPGAHGGELMARALRWIRYGLCTCLGLVVIELAVVDIQSLNPFASSKLRPGSGSAD
jgi:hypothetical protein